VIHEDGSPFQAIRTLSLFIATRKAVHGVIMGFIVLFQDNVWLLVDAIPQKIVNNTVEQVVCTFIDITGRKEAELAWKKRK
jgi:hypothetical protein